MIKNKLAVLLTSVVFGVSALSVVASAETNTKTQQTINTTEKKALKEELKSIKALPEAQRKAKIQELKAKYPNAFKNHRKHQMHKFQELAKTNPQLATDLAALKNLPKDQKKVKMQEIRAKYLKK